MLLARVSRWLGWGVQARGSRSLVDRLIVNSSLSRLRAGWDAQGRRVDIDPRNWFDKNHASPNLSLDSQSSLLSSCSRSMSMDSVSCFWVGVGGVSLLLLVL